MAAKDNAWRSFQEEMKRKRTKVGAKDRKWVKKSELVVQRLGAEVAGKVQKFSRVDEDLTLEGIKSACEKHFARTLSGNLKYDVLAGEQGPSCKTLDRVPNVTKLIHVRFMKCDENDMYKGINSDSSDKGTQRHVKGKQTPKSCGAFTSQSFASYKSILS
ncbi:Hypothetical predicted protein [Paramuricea clavata]|uniref:Uncharacterized protein n=1 Tax=Paramuricea clavata TaxID=317549 RepID=A0A6S7G3M7_PARCT|nr:Hypothetical predicted protein [Paramuricea clavata]